MLTCNVVYMRVWGITVQLMSRITLNSEKLSDIKLRLMEKLALLVYFIYLSVRIFHVYLYYLYHSIFRDSIPQLIHSS